MVASWRLATAQGGVWEAFPANPTVGDTIWLVRALVVPAGWQVRAAKFEPTEDVEPLTEPSVRRVAGAWVVRYALAAWKPGAHKLGLPPIWRLGPDGRADSTAGGVASFGVASVIPDTLKDPTPQAPLAPLRLAHRNALPPLAAAGIAIVLLGAGVAMRRRPPRALAPRPQVPVEREVPDARWLAAGEPRAVVARAMWRLRAALAKTVPEAHLALDTAECLAMVEQARPHAPIRELRDLLEQLDRVAFASAHGTDISALALLARRLAKDVAA
ncbi:MAG: hypothetical protein E6K55_12385 [Gemmatimonadetes bacterium]|nr:MAG: hypothetical protein E6K55_12385 [Gemmatimonadota bacterium]